MSTIMFFDNKCPSCGEPLENYDILTDPPIHACKCNKCGFSYESKPQKEFTSNNIMQGWQCPICRRIYSPTTSMCAFCGNWDITGA